MFLRILWELLDLGDLVSRFLAQVLKNLGGSSQRTCDEVLASATNDGSEWNVTHSSNRRFPRTHTGSQDIQQTFPDGYGARESPYPTHHKIESAPRGGDPGGPNPVHPSSPELTDRDRISSEIASPRLHLGSLPSPPRALRGLCPRKGSLHITCSA